MKAQVLYEIGNLQYSDIKVPDIKEDEALVKVSACGICGSDIPRVFKTGAHNMPLVPGHEMAGVVERCDSRPDLVGKRVGIFPLIPCKKCPQCLARNYEMCENYDYLGSRSDGGYAEYVKVPVWNLLPIPNEVENDDAAMLEPMCVAVHALRLMNLIRANGKTECDGDGDAAIGSCDDIKYKNIAVCGLGTIGLFVVLFLKDAGYQNVFCIGNKDIQRKKLLDMGYESGQIIDIREVDAVAELQKRTGGRGADVYFECIGRSENYEQAVSCAAPFGQIMLVGNPASDMSLSREIYWKILRNQLTLRGTWNSSFYGIDGKGDDWRYALDRLVTWSKLKAEGKSIMLPHDLITHRFSLKDMNLGLDIMRTKSEEYVKVMVGFS